MLTETQAIKRAIGRCRSGGRADQIAAVAAGLVFHGSRLNISSSVDYRAQCRVRKLTEKRLTKRIAKKLAQPFRRKPRRRRRAAGKNEVRRRR